VDGVSKPPSPLAPSLFGNPAGPPGGVFFSIVTLLPSLLPTRAARQEDSHLRTIDAIANDSPAAATTSRHLTAKPLMMTLTLTQASKVQRRMAGGTPTVKGSPPAGGPSFGRLPRGKGLSGRNRVEPYGLVNSAHTGAIAAMGRSSILSIHSDRVCGTRLEKVASACGGSPSFV
jgi:hypothetical protein